MRRRLASSALLLAAVFASTTEDRSAGAQSYSAARPPAPRKRAFLSGTVAIAESFDLEQNRGKAPERFSIVVIEGAAPTDPFPIEDKGAEIGPFTATCKKYFAVFSGASADDVKKLVGKTVKGVVSLDPVERKADQESKSECVLVDGLDGVIAGAKRFTLGRLSLTDTAPNRAQIERARGLFEPDLSEVRYFDQTPLDSGIEYALADMSSTEALELAIRLRMYSAIEQNYRWRTVPESYGVFEKDLVASTWPGDQPNARLARLFWHASSTKALAKVVELAPTRPVFVQAILEENAGWLNASALYVELVDAKKIAFGSPRGLLHLGTEDAFLERHRTDNPQLTHDIDAALAASKEKQSSGFDVGWSLVRWVAKNKTVPRHDDGMRITLTGSPAVCCDLRGMISDDVDLEVRVDCDAEQNRMYCDGKSVPLARTVTGVVKTLQYTTHRLKAGAPERPIVRVEVATATVTDGGVIPEPASLDDAVPAPSAAAPSAPAPSSGCGCVTSGEPAVGAACVLAVAAICAVGARVRRRRSPRHAR